MTEGHIAEQCPYMYRRREQNKPEPMEVNAQKLRRRISRRTTGCASEATELSENLEKETEGGDTGWMGIAVRHFKETSKANGYLCVKQELSGSEWANILKLNTNYAPQCGVPGGSGQQGEVGFHCRKCGRGSETPCAGKMSQLLPPYNTLTSLLFRNLGEEVKKKVTLLTGDVSMPNIGLSWTDIERIKERVQVVFHVAAIVNFSAALDKAVITNVGGTAALLALAKDMTNLEAMVYVSTAYCNCTVDGFVEEKVYQSRWDPVEFLRDVMESPSEEINRRKRELIGNHPNTYSFSKQLAENLIAQEGGDLPIAIIRPSIVLNTAERPIEGWTYNVLSGAFAFIAGAGRGAFRTIYADGNAVADHVPSDYFIAFLIAAAWKTAVHRNFQVYHYTSGTVRPILWSDYLSTVMKYMDKYPTANTVIPPRAKCRKGYIHNWFVVLLFHYLPALILDLLDVSLDVPFRCFQGKRSSLPRNPITFSRTK
nr:putative fatty acyl-CoA reductase CG8303 [Halyomorpha halys]